MKKKINSYLNRIGIEVFYEIRIYGIIDPVWIIFGDKGDESMSYQNLNDKIYEMKDEILNGIKESIQIPSVKGAPEEGAPYGREPKRALEHALKLGEELGFKVKNVDDKAGWVEFGEGEELVGILGHLDVVPVGEEGWDYPAFSGEIHDGVMYGRGVLDDKGPTIGAIYALKAIRDLGIPLKRRIRVIFGTDEENGSSCVQHYVESGEEIPTIGFTPDADFPLIFFEKGMTVMIAGSKKAEQGAVKVLEFKGGAAPNIVMEKCRLVLEGVHAVSEQEGVKVSVVDGNTVVEAEGVGAHGSKPELGVNAAVLLFKAVKDLEIGGSFQKVRDFILAQIGTETNGKTLGICYQDDETGETTVNLGLIGYKGDSLFFTLDIRYPKNGKADEVYANLERALTESGLDVLQHSTVEPLYMPKDSELVQKLMKVYKELTGRDDEPLAIGGGTYAKMLPNTVAFGPVFPGTPDVIHQPNERVLVEELIQSIQLTADAMVELAQ